MTRNMETGSRLNDAAVTGDVNTLQELVHQDKLIFERISLTLFKETPLHIASMMGHSEFVKEILKHNSKLTKELDSRKSTPLHIACTKGYSEIVKELLRVDPDMGFARDIDGRNPLHLAAMKDRIEVLKLLIEMRPGAAFGKTNGGENVLHLCVKYGQLEALKKVLEMVGDGIDEIVAGKDGGGNTILHLAVLGKQIETIKHLVTRNKIAINEKNVRGETALDISSKMQTDDADLEIRNIISKAGGLKANRLPFQQCCGFNLPFFNQHSGKTPPAEGLNNWLLQKRDSIMIVASLIAAMAFEAGINPPGGCWQDSKLVLEGNDAINYNNKTHTAGHAIMATIRPDSYINFFLLNTMAFISSLSTILLLISGLPLRHRFYMWLFMAIMCFTLTASALTYLVSTTALTPSINQTEIFRKGILWSILVWCGLVVLVIVWNTGRMIVICLKRRGRFWPPTKWRKPTPPPTSSP